MSHDGSGDDFAIPSGRTSRDVTFYPCDQPGCGQLADNALYEVYVNHLATNHGINPPSMMPTTEAHVTYYPCDQPDCHELAHNPSHELYVNHLAMDHGIDPPSMVRTTESWYLEAKTKAVLEMHVTQEAKELNDLNAKIRNLETCLAGDLSLAQRYDSRHGFDVTRFFKYTVGLIPHTTRGLVTYLKRIRDTRNELGFLYSQPGVLDTRDGVLDDLEMLLDFSDGDDDDSSDSENGDGADAVMNGGDGAPADSEPLQRPAGGVVTRDLEAMLATFDNLLDNQGSRDNPINLDPDVNEEHMDAVEEALDHQEEMVDTADNVDGDTPATLDDDTADTVIVIDSSEASPHDGESNEDDAETVRGPSDIDPEDLDMMMDARWSPLL